MKEIALKRKRERERESQRERDRVRESVNVNQPIWKALHGVFTYSMLV